MHASSNRATGLVALGSTIALTVGTGPILVHTFGVFPKPGPERFAEPPLAAGASIGLLGAYRNPAQTVATSRAASDTPVLSAND